MAEQDNTLGTSDAGNDSGAKGNTIITVTTDARTENKTVRFNTPAILEIVKAADDGSKIRIAVKDSPDADLRILLDDDKAVVAEALQRSIVPPAQIGNELRKFTQFLLDHSNLKAIGAHAIYVDDAGADAGFGFVTTSADCTIGQAVALVNCGDANMDEFTSKAKLNVPGRGAAQDKDGILVPTPEQVEKLG